MLHLQIDVTSSFKQLFRDSIMPICCRDEERCAPILSLKIHVTAGFNELRCDGSMSILGRDE
jgi:hypothetical protein